MVPARLQKDSPQCLQRNRRPGGPSFVRYVPLETMLPFPVLPYNEHLGLGQASCCNLYCGFRPLFAILYPPLDSQDSIKGVICQLLKGHYQIFNRWKKRRRSGIVRYDRTSISMQTVQISLRQRGC